MAWTRKSCHVSGQKESDNFLDSKSVLQIFLFRLKTLAVFAWRPPKMLFTVTTEIG